MDNLATVLLVAHAARGILTTCSSFKTSCTTTEGEGGGVGGVLGKLGCMSTGMMSICFVFSSSTSKKGIGK